MIGGPGCRTMEMNGGSSASYLGCTPCVPLVGTLCFIRGGNRGVFRLPGEGGIMSFVRWNLRPVMVGVNPFLDRNHPVDVPRLSCGNIPSVIFHSLVFRPKPRKTRDFLPLSIPVQTREEQQQLLKTLETPRNFPSPPNVAAPNVSRQHRPFLGSVFLFQ